MMKKIYLSVFLLLAPILGRTSTENLLLNTLFTHAKIKGFLEFGLGTTTPYLLDSCSKVISVEFVTPGYGPGRMKQCLELYKKHANWIPITFFSGLQQDVQWAPYKYLASEHYHRATSYQTSTLKDYSQIDSFYLMELDSFIGNLVKCHKLQAALINGVVYLRGDLVQLLFNKIPIIIAEGTTALAHQSPQEPYGYSRITTPENYIEIYIPKFSFTIWVLNETQYQPLIEKLKTL